MNLTPRQRQIVCGFFADLCIKEIAWRLKISPKCVEWHWAKLKRTCHVKTHAGLLLVLLAGCATRQPAIVTPPMPTGIAVVKKATKAATPLMGVVTPAAAPLAVPPPTRTYTASWDYWSQGVAMMNTCSNLTCGIWWTTNLLSAWTEVSTNSPTATNCTFTLPAVPVNFFRTGYTL